MQAVQNWYDGMNRNQRILVWFVALALWIIVPVGQIATAMLLYLNFGSDKNPILSDIIDIFEVTSSSLRNKLYIKITKKEKTDKISKQSKDEYEFLSSTTYAKLILFAFIEIVVYSTIIYAGYIISGIFPISLTIIIYLYIRKKRNNIDSLFYSVFIYIILTIVYLFLYTSVLSKYISH